MRTTPALLALFSIVTVVAHQQQSSIRLSCQKPLGIGRRYRRLQKCACRTTTLANTVSDVSAGVDTVKVPRALFNTWSDLLCYNTLNG